MSSFKVAGKMSLDGSAFFSTMNAAKGAVNSLGGALAGAFSIGAIASFSKSVLDLAGKLNDVSDALGINVEYLQKFVNSAAKSGGSLQDVEKFLFESSKSRQAALNQPEGKEAAAFGRLGFSQNDISKLNPQEFMNKLIEAFGSGATPEKINDIAEIGGKSAKKLVGGFKDGLDETTAIIRDELIQELDEIGDKFTSIGTSLKSQFAPVLMIVADAFQFFIDRLEQAQNMLGEWLGSIIGASGSGRNLSDVLKEGTSDAVAAQQRTEEEQNARDAEVKKTREAKAAARKATQEAPPDFKPQEKESGGLSASPAQKRQGITSDSLLSVGNFLGAGKTSSLESINQQQLQQQQQIVALMRQLVNKTSFITGIPTV